MDSLNEVVGTSCKRVKDELFEKGIDDDFTCKIKELKHVDWLAQYRSNSQFSSRPIFWINKDLYKKIGKINPYTVASDNIRHEYGHVIAEWGYARNPEISKIIRDNWTNEEEFAEGFSEYLGKSAYAENEEEYDKILKLFKKDLG